MRAVANTRVPGIYARPPKRKRPFPALHFIYESVVHNKKRLKTDFTNIKYLRRGNERQKRAYAELTKLSIFEHLQDFKPILTGTIPIGVDLPESDLDIICQCSNHLKFTETLNSLYSNKKNYQVRTSSWNDLESTIATFQSGEFEVEIFGQDCPTKNQNAYRHMIIEHRILNSEDDKFKAEIIQLKQEGLKTESAFARALGLHGNPYEELLKFEKQKLHAIKCS